MKEFRFRDATLARNSAFMSLNDERIASGTAHGFYRPYDQDRGGVAPERWHLSHGPVSTCCEQELTVHALRETVAGSEMELKSTVLANLDEIYERFVINTSPWQP